LQSPGILAPMTEDKELVAVGTDEEARVIDEDSQRLFDLSLLYSTLKELRGMLANAKLNYQIARTIGIEGLHPKQFLKAIEEHRKHMDLVIGLIQKAEAGEAIEEPRDLGLVIAQDMPTSPQDH
jgi:hypothetical protein